MAEEVFEFPQALGRGRAYPWDEWLNGNIWKLTQGKDFEANMSNFRALVYLKAQDRGLHIRTQVSAPYFFLQATPREP